MKRRKNPGKVQGGERLDMIRAAKLYRDFSGDDGTLTIERVRIPALPKTAVIVGMLDAIEYTTFREGETQYYRHEFSGSPDKGGPDCRALIAVSKDGRQVLILGGKFRFTERGFVDAGE